MLYNRLFRLINHFPNHFELTRKDLMVKNIKRYMKDIARDSSILGRLPPPQDFIPITYLLPADYSIFVEEFRRNPNAVWIMKPTSRSQGYTPCHLVILSSMTHHMLT
jgi:tubulin polyglutamylase TTLL1